MDSFMKELVGDITDVQIVDDSPSSYIPDRLLSPNTSFEVYGDDDEDDDGSSQFQGPIESYCFSSSSSSLFHEEDTATKFHQQHCPSPSSVLDIAGCCSTPTSTANRSYGSDKILDGFRERQRLIRESFMKSPGIVVESSSCRRRRSPTTPSSSSRRTSYSPTAPRKQLNDEETYSNLRTKLDGVRLF